MNKTYRSTLHHYRTAAKLTQVQLSKLTGIAQNTISAIEVGKIKIENVTLKNGVALAKAVGVGAEKLVE